MREFIALFQVNCGRFVSGHMSNHHTEIGHCLVLSFRDLSVWCYECDSYIDNKVKKKFQLDKPFITCTVYFITAGIPFSKKSTSRGEIW